MEVCGVKPSVDILGFKARTDNFFVYLVGTLAITGFLFAVGQLIRRRRAEKRRVRLQGQEVSQVVHADYGSIVPRAASAEDARTYGSPAKSYDEHAFVGEDYYPERPLWIM